MTVHPLDDLVGDVVVAHMPPPDEHVGAGQTLFGESVLDVVASFGGQVVVREWFEMDPPGDPHTFELTVSLGSLGSSAPSAE